MVKNIKKNAYMCLKKEKERELGSLYRNHVTRSIPRKTVPFFVLGIEVSFAFALPPF